MGGNSSKQAAKSEKPAFGVSISEDLITNLAELQNEPPSIQSSNPPNFDLNTWRAQNSAKNTELDLQISKLQSNYESRGSDAQERINAVDYKLSQNPVYNGSIPCQDVQSRLTSLLVSNDLEGVKNVARELKACMRDDLRAKANAM
ncbi:hypothetical protein TrLO_g15172 [Triparma laevis f. longispina]|uniref:Uncharacterized protein n=1 Tax=Triparma laevis f. longispina TaxID=1714387 RepID=A0A9W7FP55_9STRA|nr:hypothetical protein TrLO_g15172 [Triparma laevis f. longispina]